MFGLGFGEILIVLVLALILLGPDKLPDAAKTLGKGLREFKKATDDLRGQFEGELYGESRPSIRKLAEPPVPAAPSDPASPAPAARADNVPGLEAALAEAAAAPSLPAPPAGETAPGGKA
jgi:sec-independent protein translocase protein TatB